MKSLKNKPIEKIRRTFALFGLVTALFVTHVALTYKSFEKPNKELEVALEPVDNSLPVIITIRDKPDLPKEDPKKEITKIVTQQIIDPSLIIKEPTFIEDPSSDLDNPTFDDIKIVEEGDLNEIEVWNVLDRKPIYEGCEGLKTEKEREACFKQKLTEHVSKNFNIKPQWGMAEDVYIHFVISKEGKVTEIICTRGDNENKIEATRVIKMLPNFVPARYHGKNVATRFTLPIKIQN